ncbi:hypothetical protein AYO21_04203 [Fonsecaea monophora]|uniref:Uncharacterized protein n=1 Tax=Fonsecaea monophora TaxID=254056 RepID=A0A177FCU0_9EURO|nr:hypothetical protein AYO21_04203 [Fonsecaea monophora]OAG41501.1 hypothetical protein AYO21_04203 [Fonsecaea monophora]
MDASNDGSESVDQFLARIASLSSKQGQEEAERSKRMEEEMLQARKERQARRAERARSLSPSKTGPTPSSRLVGDSPRKPTQGIDPPVALTPPPLQSRTLGRADSMSPRPERVAASALDFTRPLPPPPTSDKPSTPNSTMNATALSRSGTLSWQQRPSSRGVGSRSRPLSVTSIPDSALPPNPGQPKDTDDMSRKDIAASLGAKDPSWFRQTADRGVGSAAYRKNEADLETAPSFTGRGMRLPGMSKDSNASVDRSREDPEKATPPPSPPKSSFAQPLDQEQLSKQEEPRSVRPLSMVSLSPSKPPALDLPSFKPLDLNTSLTADTPGLGRTSSILSTAGRPPSPTKGLGGFVESAMMKRSDSVSKRWSVQANAGLKRGDSVATSRPPHVSSASGFSPGHSRGPSRDVRGVRDGNSSPLSSSRPVSSHGAEPIPLSKARPLSRAEDDTVANSEPAIAQSSQAGRETSKAQHQNRPTTPPPPLETLLSRSPSKTMDPRRWSPTKASWLESALNKPDSPKFTPAKSETPAWKLNMQRAKQEQQQRSSEAAGNVQAKPTVGPKPLISPSLKDSAILSEPEPQKGLSSVAADEVDSAKGVEAESSQPRDIPASDTEQPRGGKREEKPAVPSKRNVTPILHGTTLDNKPEAAAVASNEDREVSVEALQANASPDPKPPMLKPKPQTPPKTDFRATLKSRQAAPASNSDAEPEFKAVFGKLKRTQTQNYVAPDLLKDNITRGKAGLNTTGGPQKTKRVDEFKESILQKKEAMKTGGGVIGKRPDAPSPLEKPAQAVPEALARRMTLHKTGPSSEKIEVKKAVDLPTKPAVSASKPQSYSAKPVPDKQDDSTLTQQAPISVQKAPAIKPEKTESVSTTILPTKGAPQTTSSNNQPKADTSLVAAPPATESAFKMRAPENSKLAARLNPALAGVLSRSGSPKPLGERSSNGGGAIQVRDTLSSRENANDQNSELTHMTKARAKGPKRRAPKSGPSSKETVASTIEKPMSKFGTGTATISDNKTSVPSRLFESRPTSGKLMAEVEENKPSVSVEESASQPKLEFGKRRAAENVVRESSPARPRAILESDSNPKSKPAVASKSAELRKVSNPGMAAHIPDEPAPVESDKSAELKKASNPALPPKRANQPPQAKPSTPKKFEVLADRAQVVSPPPQFENLRKSAPLSPPLAVNSPLTPNKFKINTPKEPKPEVDNSVKPSSLASSRATGLGLQFSSASKKPAATPELTPPPEPEASTRKLASFRCPASPTKSGRLLKAQFERFFGVLPQAREKAEFDTQAFLSSQKNTSGKPKTLGKQIWEVSGDGKRTAMPPQQEHILFEDCMYLCVHSMESPSGSKCAEVYLWCGDEVPEAAVEDAQLFCRKIARDNNAKLEVVKQGKESSEFFQALGGIVIVRKSKSAALYMLCGRRHLGHVAFDEVELSADNLSSGLPFLISAKFGKLYLWKGNDSNPEDVGCARLIGMDMGLTGEIEEVSEGKEPASFWEAFPSRPSKRVAPRTRKQTSLFHGHAPRLYRVEHDRPKSSGGFWGLRAASPPKQAVRALVDEIAPFNQKDLDANHIHILDTYGELYVLVGASAKKPAEFVTAVQVAQEIAVLSPSVQDRPLLPACYVVMGDPPENIKSVFRKWRSERSASPDDQLCVRVEEVIQELGITL